uniref:Copine-3 n=1 Tax=Trichuris muris TaxID=70415 RepID=A0A5S6R351_TRIMR
MAALFAGFTPASAHLYVTVELAVSCRNLPDTDVFSKSDPMCVMFTKVGQGDWQEAGRTEVIRNSVNPDFVRKFIVDYEFEARQPLKFEVYDVDSASMKLDDHDFLGRLECTLAELVSEPRFESVLLDGPGRVPSTIVIVAEEQMESKEEVSFNIRAENLDNKRFLCKSNPQLAIYRINEDSSWTVVYRTEVVSRCLNPVWRPFSIGSSLLCCSDQYRSLRFRCVDWHGSGSEKLIGEFETNLVDLIAASENGTANFELMNGRKKRKKTTYQNSGKLIIKTTVTVVDSFLDYIKAGTDLSCAFAIDFTSSNGHPERPTSLHRIHPYLLNPYQMAIRAVGDIVRDYDSDQLFPVLGFGARLPSGDRVSHDFNVNGSSVDPLCPGIEGVLRAYSICLQSVQLAGPTNFAPVISHVARLASKHTDGSKYFILLIITDGIISDMAKTQEVIVEASALPLSLIIVGVGDGDFTEMRILDGDQVRLSSKGRTAPRDIVQFVAMRDCVENMTAHSSELAAARLSREVLAEIPFQILSFMKSKGITPEDVRKLTSRRGQTSMQPVFNGNAQKGLMIAPDAPPPYEATNTFCCSSSRPQNSVHHANTPSV